MKPNNKSLYDFILNGIGLSYLVLLQMLVASSGSKTTAEAYKTRIIFSQIFAENNPDESQKTDFNFFMTQVKSREHYLQNILFTINWKNLVAVSRFFDFSIEAFKLIKLIASSIKSTSQVFSTVITYLVISCQLEAA